MQLTKDFWLGEFTKSQTADRSGLDNSPGNTELYNIRILCEEFLQPLRDLLGESIMISSGYRSYHVNALVGGSENSAHRTGEAVDIEAPSLSTPQFAEFVLSSGLEFDQLILEFHDPSEGPYSGWVHVSYRRGKNRRQVLTATKEGNRTKYLPGLVY